MSEEKTPGLLLHATAYLGKRRILKVLTPEHGLVTLMAQAGSLTTPYLWAEWVFRKDKKEIHKLTDGSILDALPSLKEEYSRLTTAGRMANDLLRTQFSGKSAHEPLLLALACFRKAALFSEPEVLHAFFRLKLLLCEGLLFDEDLTSASLQTLAYTRAFSELALLPKDEQAIKHLDRLFNERLV